jgi:BASS family bile acid:Na+ symporter
LRPDRLLAAAAWLGLPLSLVGVLLGLSLPPLADLARDGAAVAVGIMLTVTFFLAEPGRLSLRVALPPLALAGATLLLSPVLVLAVMQAVEAPEALGWLVLVAAAPVGGSAALAAGLLGLPLRSLALAQLALPLTAPLVAGIVAVDLGIEPAALLQRILWQVGLPALLGLALRRALGAHRAALAVRLRGLGVLAMASIACAVTAGLPAALAGCALAGWIAAGVLAVSAGGAALGALVAPGLPRPERAAMALGGALRNGSVLWPATLGLPGPEGALGLQLTALWTYLLPGILAAAVRLLRARRMAMV